MLRTAELYIGSPRDNVIRKMLAAALAGSKPSDVDGSEQGWVAIAYQNAFYHLAHGSSFEDALVGTVGLGVILIRMQLLPARYWGHSAGSEPYPNAGFCRCFHAARMMN